MLEAKEPWADEVGLYVNEGPDCVLEDTARLLVVESSIELLVVSGVVAADPVIVVPKELVVETESRLEGSFEKEDSVRATLVDDS